MAVLFKDNASGALASAITNVATSLTLVAGQGAKFPAITGSDYFYLTLIGLDANGNENSWEIVKVTARATDVLTVTRGRDGTTATAWSAGTRIELRLTANILSNLTEIPSDFDTAFGNNALSSKQSVGSNSAFGADALKNLTTGTNNTAVGRRAGMLLSTGSKNTIIGGFDGSSSGLDIRTLSNHIVLSDGDGNPRAYFNANGSMFVQKSVSFTSEFIHTAQTTGAVAIDFVNGQNQKLTLTGNATSMTFAFPGVGHYQLEIISGAFTVAFPTIGATWQWLNATTAPTLNTGTYGGIVNIYWDGTMAVASYSKVGAV